MKKYLIYDALIKNHNDAPFKAILSLLKILDIQYECVKTSTNDIGYDLRYRANFADLFKSALKEAKVQNMPLVALENSSYLSLKEANKELDIGAEVLHVNYILATSFDPKDIVHDFSEFNAGIYYGSDDESLEQSALAKLLQATKTKEIQLAKTYSNDGFAFLEVNRALAHKMAGEILFDAFDNSCDFLVVNDIRSFNIFDTEQKKVAKVYGRSLENGLPILSIAQVLLMALGKTKPKECFVDLHAIKPAFI